MFDLEIPVGQIAWAVRMEVLDNNLRFPDRPQAIGMCHTVMKT